jgi:hypothetical protein
MVLEPGDKIHIVEHRRFQEDIRRHFIGEVEAATDQALRATGYLFLYEKQAASFTRDDEPRTRVFAIENTVGITVLPPETDIDNVAYQRDDKGLAINDRAGVRFGIGIFGPSG